MFDNMRVAPLQKKGADTFNLLKGRIGSGL
jgi:hypothetical protein